MKLPHILDAQQVCQLTRARYGRAIDPSTLYRWIKRGRFPKPDVAIGFQYKGWLRKTAVDAMKKIMGTV